MHADDDRDGAAAAESSLGASGHGEVNLVGALLLLVGLVAVVLLGWHFLRPR